MARVLVYGNLNSPLIRQRGLVGQRGGHEIFWFSPEKAGLPGVWTFSLPRLVKNNLLLRTIVEPLYLQKITRDVQPDLVHVHYASRGLSAFPLSRYHPLVVSTMGGDILPEQGYGGIYAPFTKFLLDRADCITSKSDFMDSALDKIGDYRKKIRRITWGINLNVFHPNRDVNYLRENWDITKDDFVFFDPRIAKPFYNKHIIFEAFARFTKMVDSAILLTAELFADPNYLAQLHHLADALGISRKVRFLGTIDYDQMPDYYNLANVTVSVPSSDGLPQTIYESFACGSFLITGNLPQYSDIVQNDLNAKTVKIGDSEDLAQAMIWAYEHPDARSQIVIHNRQYVKDNADSEQQADYLNEIYQTLLDGRFSNQK